MIEMMKNWKTRGGIGIAIAMLMMVIGIKPTQANEIVWGPAIQAVAGDGSVINVEMGMECTSSWTQSSWSTGKKLNETIGAANLVFANSPAASLTGFQFTSNPYYIINYMLQNGGGYVIQYKSSPSQWDYNAFPVITFSNFSQTGSTSAKITPFRLDAPMPSDGFRGVMFWMSSKYNIVFNGQTYQFSGGYYNGYAESNPNPNGAISGGYGAYGGLTATKPVIPSHLFPVLPFKLTYRLTFPPPKTVIRAIEPQALLNLDTLTNVNKIQVRFYLMEGTPPSNSSEIDASKAGDPISFNGVTTFDLDSIDVKFLNRFTIGKLFYKDLGKNLNVKTGLNQYLAAQFIYNGAESNKSDLFVVSANCVTYPENQVPSYTFPTVNSNNSLSVFFSALGKKLAAIMGSYRLN